MHGNCFNLHMSIINNFLNKKLPNYSQNPSQMCEQASQHQNMANMTTPMTKFVVVNTICDYMTMC
jgi:hypothetical protein